MTVNQSIDVRNLTPQALAAFGVQQLAYIKPVVHEGQHLFAIHAADGAPLALAANRAAAEVLVRQNDLEPQSVH